MSDTLNENTSPEWELVRDDGYDRTFRLAVPGGWLYMVKLDEASHTRLAYVPDPDYVPS